MKKLITIISIIAVFGIVGTAYAFKTGWFEGRAFTEGVRYYNTSGNYVFLNASSTTSDYNLYWPPALGASSTAFLIDANGNMTFNSVITGLSDLTLAQNSILVGNASNNPEATSTITVLPSGYVGIGTTSPAYELDVDGTVRAYDNLLVGNTTGSASFRGQGDIYASDGIKAMGGLYAEAKMYGTGLEVLNYDPTIIYTNIIYGDASFASTTMIMTDSHGSFGTATSTYEGAFMRIISSTPDLGGATAEIIEVISDTELSLNMTTAGSDTLLDLTGVSFVIYEHPVFFVGDNGTISSAVTEAEFHIDGTGFHGFYIDAVARVDQHQALTIDTNMTGYSGVVGLNSFLFATTTTDAVSASNLSLEINEDNITNSHLSFIDINGLGGNGNGNDIDVLHIEGLALTDHIIHQGSPDIIRLAYYDNGDGTTASTTDAFKQNDINVTLFENDNSYIYIGSDTEFTNIGYALSTNGTRDINAEYYYCDGDDSWKVLPGVTDTTNGEKITGTISFANPADRGLCNEEYDSTAFASTTPLYYIAIKRTRNNYATQKPVESIVTISGGGDFMYLDSYGFKPVPSAGAPYTCDGEHTGKTYYDSLSTALLWCTGSAWVAFAETADVTVHNNLTGLDGGTPGEYYHLTSAQHTIVGNTSGANSGDVTVSDTTTIDLTLAGQALSADSLLTFDDFITLTGASVDVDTGAIADGATTVLATSDAIYDFVNTATSSFPTQWTTTGSDIYYNTGNVGIGTSTPLAPLQISKTGALFKGQLVLSDPVYNGDTVNSIVAVTGYGKDLASGNNTGRMWYMGSASGADKDIYISNELSGNLFLATNATVAMTIDSSGNVGIGTTSPLRKFEVGGSGTGSFSVEQWATSDAYASVYLNGSSNVNEYNFLSGTTDNTLFINRPTGFNINFRENNSDSVTFASGGNVGIGTSTPFAKLAVENTGTGNSFIVGDQANDPSPFVIDASGNVGIGTDSPTSEFQVKGDADPNISIDATTNDRASYMQFLAASATTAHQMFVGADKTAGGFLLSGAGGGGVISMSSNHKLDFGTNNTLRMTILADGNVGIGTTTPVALLGIQGAIGVNASHLYLATNGRVGIGETTPETNLQVAAIDANGSFASSVNATGIFGSPNGMNLRLFVDDTNEITAIQSAKDGVGSDYALVLNPEDGNVGIASTTPTDTLSLTGQFWFNSDTATSTIEGNYRECNAAMTVCCYRAYEGVTTTTEICEAL